MLSKQLNLAIVDDHSLFRKILKDYLSERENIRVSFDALDMPEAISKLRGCPVDLLLIHLQLPKSNSDEALKLLRTDYPTLKILVISMSDHMGSIGDLWTAGINGYISKSDNPEDLLSAIRMVSENGSYCNSILIEPMSGDKQKDMNVFGNRSSICLNAREKKVLQLMWEEKSTKEIANELFLGIKSIEKIRQDLKEKIGIKSTVGLLKYAMSRKIIKIN
jgi:DNA-binding NarL/FixJ family response regulator